MTTKNDGGPAFPSAEVVDNNKDVMAYAESGMTLRDYFAAKAMQSLILNPAPELLNGCGWDHVIAGAYQAADAMLLERAK